MMCEFSGLGYIAGSFISKAFDGEWRWALRVKICFIYQ
jgi:hypothetical protein